MIYERQEEITLKYKGKIVGKHRMDFLIEDKVVVELKAVEAINKIYEAQLLTYLRATNSLILIIFSVLSVVEFCHYV